MVTTRFRYSEPNNMLVSSPFHFEASEAVKTNHILVLKNIILLLFDTMNDKKMQLPQLFLFFMFEPPGHP